MVGASRNLPRRFWARANTAGPAGRLHELKTVSRQEKTELADFETSSWELVTSCKWRADLLGAPLGLKFCDSAPLWFFFVWLGVHPMASHIALFALGPALSGSARASPLLCDPSVVGGNGDGARCGKPGGKSPRPGLTGRSGARHHGRGCDRTRVGCGSPWGLGCGGVGFVSAQIRAPQVQALESRGLVPGATARSSTTAAPPAPRAAPAVSSNMPAV